jgi:hypothetical protein
MNPHDDPRLRALLREAFPPANAAERDLWPAMLRRLESERPARSWRHLWLDFALGAAAAGWLVAFPHIIPSLMCHL